MFSDSHMHDPELEFHKNAVDIIKIKSLVDNDFSWSRKGIYHLYQYYSLSYYIEPSTWK